MNLQQTESLRIKRVGQIFLDSARHVPQDKANFKPDPNLTSANEIVQHIAWANGFFNALIQGKAPAEHAFDPELPYAQALARFEQSCQHLAAATAAVPDDQLDDARDMPWGQTWKVKHILTSGSLHIAYHWGQIGYLQKAWGDTTDYHLVP